MKYLIGMAGLLTMMILAWVISYDRRKIQVRLIMSGLFLQFLFAFLILKTGPGLKVFAMANALVTGLIGCSNVGAEFVFGAEIVKSGSLAFSVLPTIVFFSTIMTLLYHLGVIQILVRVMAWVMVRVMDVSGAESLCAAANVFVGMTEAPLIIRPYMKDMTRSELMAMLTAGLATIAGGVMAAYVAFGASAGHLMAASIMSAPASLVIAKIILPEREESMTKGHVRAEAPRPAVNVLDAACRGAGDGLKLALNVGAMLVAFIAVVALLNLMLAHSQVWIVSLFHGAAAAVETARDPLTLEKCLGWVMAPMAWIMGIEWKDASTVGMLLGKKTILNEFVAYLDLSHLRDTISPRSFTIATYALCGFANFASVGIQIGGLGQLVPERRRDLAELSLRSMIGGTLAAFMTACIAGMLI